MGKRSRAIHHTHRWPWLPRDIGALPSSGGTGKSVREGEHRTHTRVAPEGRFKGDGVNGKIGGRGSSGARDSWGRCRERGSGELGGGRSGDDGSGERY